MNHTLASFKRKIQPGTRLLCVLNEIRPELSGTYRVVRQVHTVDFTWACDPPNGKDHNSYTYWPKAKDVTQVSEDEITFHLGRPGRPDLVTLRIIDTAKENSVSDKAMTSLPRGTIVRITNSQGITREGEVISAVNYYDYKTPEIPNWYIEFRDPRYGVGYWRQGFDGGTMEVIKEAK